MSKDIIGFLKEHEASSPVSFHMPGHKGAAFYDRNGFGKEVSNLASWDITEIAGADNLFQPETIIQNTMDKYKYLYGSKKSYLLVNGSSSGIIAAILATVPKGGKLIMARNCHKSVFNALYLGDIKPAYILPRVEEPYGISGEVEVDEVVRLMDENPDASAVILGSPNYYGICSDVAEISREAHRRGMILIVDQAHGAHLKFFESVSSPDGFSLPGSAESLGADVVINSTHKTLASFTQTAVLNVCSDRMDLYALEDKLQMLESSSPSYPLMATLDINADILMIKGRELMKAWEENLKWFYQKADEIDGLALMKTNRLDPTKINLDMSDCGFNGDMLEDFLIDHDIFPELVSGDIVMCMTGIGNVRADYERLVTVLTEAASRREAFYRSAVVGEKEEKCASDDSMRTCGNLMFKGVPDGRELVPITQAVGRVCAMSVIPYPPGIPLVCPGEELDVSVVEHIRDLREAGRKVIGVDEKMRVWVGK